MASTRQLAPAQLWREYTAVATRRDRAPPKEQALRSPLALVRRRAPWSVCPPAKTKQSCSSGGFAAAPKRARMVLARACAPASAEQQPGSAARPTTKQQRSALRVVVIGSSVAEGCNAENMQGWAYRLHQRLIDAAIDVEVLLPTLVKG